MTFNLQSSVWEDEHGNRFYVRGVSWGEDPKVSLEFIPPTGKEMALSELAQSLKPVKNGRPMPSGWTQPENATLAALPEPRQPEEGTDG